MTKTLTKYTIEEHRHRFAVWAAARAAQRGFRSLKVLRAALEATDIRQVCGRAVHLRMTQAQFNKRHRAWCFAICRRLRGPGSRAPFGRAAKLVAIYVKTTVVLAGHQRSHLASVAHPPIDRRLLAEMARKHPDHSDSRLWRTTAWTALTFPKYRRLVESLRSVAGPHPLWKLEAYWQPADRDE